MFTGIIESLGIVKEIVVDGKNRHFTVVSSISDELKVDQSVAHNGVCLTVVALRSGGHTVTAVEETFRRSNLGELKVGDCLNLERATAQNARLDGHLVQGHVDTRGTCVSIKEEEGSFLFTFDYPVENAHLLVDKGSVCVNGVSLTVISPLSNRFSVAIIPFTYEHTNFNKLKPGAKVNLEFDILGKYIARYAEIYLKK